MAIELDCVVKTQGLDTHIHETTLSLTENTFNILLGTTLAGKTTLMRLMAGLERPTAGRVLFRGADVTGVAVQKRSVAMVYQQFINYPNMSVFENIASPLRVARLSREEIRTRVERTADLLKLTPMLSRRPSELSGGQQQRTALARALVKDAELVLLDEPLANLDYKLREELREELPAILAEKGATVVYATSEPQEALLLGGQTAILHEGRVIQFGPTAEVYHHPLDLRSAQVFADPPLNTARVVKAGDTVSLTESSRANPSHSGTANGAQGAEPLSWPAAGAARELADGEYQVGLRPYHITPKRVSDDALAVQAHVLVAELSGSESIVHVDIGGHAWVSQSHGVHAVDVGTDEPMFIQASRFLYFDARSGALVAS